MEFKIENTMVYGLEIALVKSGNPMRTKIENVDGTDEQFEKSFRRGLKLGNAPLGSGHDNFLKGIIVQFDVYGPLYWWKQAQRYHWFDFVSSQSTMHSMMKFDVGKQCNKYVWQETIDHLNELIKTYQTLDGDKKDLWYEIIANVPCGFHLGASMTTNYQQLKTMYNQRRLHKMDEWKIFCHWCEQLPYFMDLCLNKE